MISHHIQKHIVGVLIHQKYARFRDLRPPGVDTNLYSYHLKAMQKDGWVEKTTEGYTLTQNGLAYVDRVSLKKLNVRSQPKIISMLVVQNSDGDVLLLRRTKQPYIDTWTLPYGKTHIDDPSILEGAKREWREKLGDEPATIVHAGDGYIRVKKDETVISTTLAHVFYITDDNVQMNGKLQWVRPHKLTQYDLAPAVEQIVARTFFRDQYFFEEFEEEWQLSSGV
ncbi:MAG TPA: NUDIX hydrolase [Candidatus Saccharibacteria bacterium]|nr:NUDIX hydrolase [Candidatus Saccharibacteria bacterium]